MRKSPLRRRSPMKRGKPPKRGGLPSAGASWSERKPLARGKAKRWRPSTAGLAFWRGQRAKLAKRSGGRCEWDDFGRRCRNAATDAAHLTALKMGGDRYDSTDPRNGLDNLMHLCRPCHRKQEAERHSAEPKQGA